MGKTTVNKLLSYFFRGLLLIVPISFTVYLIGVSIQWVDGLVGLNIPGLGLIIILSAITIFGYLGSFFITRPIFETIDKAIRRLPLVNIIFTSLKDLIEAFVGDKKKFDKPVLVQLDDYGAVFKIGFITRKDLSKLGIQGMVSVYLPHSYNFSGNQFIVPESRVRPLNIKGSDAMKFIVSGGVSGL